MRNVAWAPGFINPSQLAIWPELISERADIVLADLSGHWGSRYRQSDFTVVELHGQTRPGHDFPWLARRCIWCATLIFFS